MRRKLLDQIALTFLAICVGAATLNHVTNEFALDWFRNLSAQIGALRETSARLRSLGANGEEIAFVYLQPEDTGLYFGLQYQMLPTMLLPSAQSDLLILHTRHGEQLSEYEQQNKLQLLGDAGDGFYLLRRISKSSQ